MTDQRLSYRDGHQLKKFFLIVMAYTGRKKLHIDNAKEVSVPRSKFTQQVILTCFIP